MRLRVVAVLTAAFCGVGLSFWLGSTPAAADVPRVTAGAPCLLFWPGMEEHSYIGSKKCKKCHIKVYKSWEDTKMAKAFDTLKPGKAADAKKAHGLDPEKDYTKDETCLPCHTIGFGKKGGYTIPDADDKSAAKDAADREGVGCEACHGPGEAYSEIFKEIQESERKYKLDEVMAAGLVKPDEANCQTCHNEKSPTYDKDKAFDFEKQKDEAMHEHLELKQRED